MNLKDVIANGVIIGMSGALLWHFLNIWRYEQYLVTEPNLIVRSVETAGLLIILVFGISRYIRNLKRKPEKRYRKRPQVMSFTERLTYKYTETSKTDDNTPDLNGWKRIGNFGSYVIYASGDVQRLIDPNTGSVITQYRHNEAGGVVIDA